MQIHHEFPIQSNPSSPDIITQKAFQDPQNFVFYFLGPSVLWTGPREPVSRGWGGVGKGSLGDGGYPVVPPPILSRGQVHVYVHGSQHRAGKGDAD